MIIQIIGYFENKSVVVYGTGALTFGNYNGSGDALWGMITGNIQNQLDLIALINSGGGTIDTDFASIETLIASNGLVPMTWYRFEHTTVHYVQDITNIGSEDIHYGTPEYIYILANSTNTFYKNAISESHPEDTLHWEYFTVDGYNDAVLGESTGTITYRCDAKLNRSKQHDFRNTVFRLWESVEDSGIFDSNINTGFAYQDFPSFPLGYEENVHIGGVNDYLRDALMIPYYNDNTLIFDANLEGFYAFKTIGSWLNLIPSGAQLSEINALLLTNANGISNSFIATSLDNQLGGGILNTHINNLISNSGDFSISNSDVGEFSGNTTDESGIQIDKLKLVEFRNNEVNENILGLSGQSVSDSVFNGEFNTVTCQTIGECEFVNAFNTHTFLTSVSAKTITATTNMGSFEITASRTAAYGSVVNEHFEEEFDGTQITWTQISS
jgi:hypothetical protein